MRHARIYHPGRFFRPPPAPSLSRPIPHDDPRRRNDRHQEQHHPARIRGAPAGIRGRPGVPATGAAAASAPAAGLPRAGGSAGPPADVCGRRSGAAVRDLSAVPATRCVARKRPDVRALRAERRPTGCDHSLHRTYGVCGIISAIVFFPIGLICLWYAASATVVFMGRLIDRTRQHRQPNGVQEMRMDRARMMAPTLLQSGITSLTSRGGGHLKTFAVRF